MLKPQESFATVAAARLLTLMLVGPPALGAVAESPPLSDLTAHRLRCEYLTDPIGIDETKPRLSWALRSPRRGARQTAYQIVVASRPEHLASDRGDLWDSGKVHSTDTTQVTYDGPELRSRQSVWWKVRSWDQSGEAGPWSVPASWEMGLIAEEDWRSDWIARTESRAADQPLPLFRREFNLGGGVVRARLYVCGVGYHEVHINGQTIGDSCLDPAYTRYDKRLLYVTHDVTASLRGGGNAVGVMLGNGWMNVSTKAPWNFDSAPWRASPRVRLELHVEFADGGRRVIATDDQWKTAPGPITRSSIYGGETHDARLEQPGWDGPGFDDAGWDWALVVDSPGGRLTAQMMPPIRATQAFNPIAVTEPEEGVMVFDFGQNMSGFVELAVTGAAGESVELTCSELLGENGRVDQENIARHVWSHGREQTFQTDKYILKGGGAERWRPRFSCHGFRYVEVVNPPGTLSAESLTAHFIHTDVKPVGEFRCSNDLLNKIWNNARYSYLSNLQGIPTDCPHREKNGWTGDAHLACEFGLLNYDSAAVYSKWIADLQDEQQDDGRLPGIVPTSGWGYDWGNGPAWDSAYLLIPDYLRSYCGDNRLLERQFEGHRRYVDYLTDASDGLIIPFGLNDWAPWKAETPTEVTSTAYFYRDAQVVAQTAKRLGDQVAAEKYSRLARDIRAAYQRRFYDHQQKQFAPTTQTALSCALYQGLATTNQRPALVEQLVAQVAKNDYHIDTGILGSKYLLAALSDNGRADVALRVASQDTQPSWGWWIRQGATTLWEQWTIADSHNHIMFGDVAAWFTRAIVGIKPDPLAPGFANVIIEPNPVGDLQWAEASHESLRGKVRVGWRRAAGRLLVDVRLPANVTATVRLPTDDAADLIVDNQSVGDNAHAELAGVAEGRAVLQLGSGEHSISTPYEAGGRFAQQRNQDRITRDAGD